MSIDDFMSTRPLFSVITVCRNSEEHIRCCIESVLSQQHPSCEYIIIDGGSQDCTTSIIEEYKESIDVFISEEDNGIYDAFNKGLSLATGQIIRLLNSDDILPPQSLAYVERWFVNNQCLGKPALLIGSSHVINLQGLVVGSITHKPVIVGFESFNHPAWFLTRQAFEIAGYYNPSYKIAGDYEYFLRLKKSLIPVYRTTMFLASYRKGGASSHGLCGPLEVLRANILYKMPLKGVIIFIQQATLRLVKTFYLVCSCIKSA